MTKLWYFNIKFSVHYSCVKISIKNISTKIVSFLSSMLSGGVFFKNNLQKTGLMFEKSKDG